MKIAVATDDFKTVTGHVGRCNGFLIFEVEEGKILSEEKRENNFTNHKKENHNDHNHSHQHGHSHADLVDGIADCSHLICTTAGWRLQDDFKNANKELIFTVEEIAEEAAKKLSLGTLEINEDGSCHAH